MNKLIEPSHIEQEGLPDISKKNQKNPLLLLIFGAIIAIFLIKIWWSNKSEHQKPTQPIEETYAVQDSMAKGQPTPGDAPNTTPNTGPTNQPPQLNQQQIAFIQAQQTALQQRLASPLMLVNNRGAKTSGATPISGANTGDPNTKFMNQVSTQSSDTVIATRIGPLNYIVAEGNLIQAVLEPAINSDLPGYLRAAVSQPVYSEDGSQILIPQGSRLIGQYKNGMTQGQSRAFVVWTRLIIPGGISVNLGSPGVDNLGMAGIGADSIDHHFFQQFGTAILLSVIGAGASNVGVSSGNQYNAAQAYRIAMADSLSQTATQNLQQNESIPPTLWIHQGKNIQVFVAHDLNFQSAMQQTKQKVEIF